MALLSTISEAVKVSLNSASLSESFTPVRYWRFPQNLEGINGEVEPRVIVVGAGWTTQASPSSRARTMLLTYLVDIAVIKAIDTTIADAADAYSDLTEEIRGHLLDAGTMGTANFINAETSPLINQDLYDQEEVFLSGTRVTYQTFDQ